MSDSRLNQAERALQPRFSKLLILFAFLVLAQDSRKDGPNRTPQPSRLAALVYEPHGPARQLSSQVRLTGSWRVSAEDPRLAGLSGLAATGGGRLLAVTDSGVIVDLPDPAAGRRVARFTDLPAGPGFPTYKKYRDSEALLAERLPNGDLVLQVAFEHVHSIWRYQLGGSPRIESLRLPRRGWSANRAIEAMVEAPAGGLLLLPEDGAEVLAVADGRVTPQRLEGATGGVAEAVRLPDGRVIVAIREVGFAGITNRLAWLEPINRGYRLRPFATLPLGPFDNVEGLTAEPLPGTGAILWAVTDNDGWRRTLLLRLEIAGTTPATGRAGG